MLYSQKLQAFTAAHTLEERTVDGARFRYVLCGKADGKTLVFLNGGMNTLEMWMDYADKMADDYRVLLFDYPQVLATNQAVVKGMHAFFKVSRFQSIISFLSLHFFDSNVRCKLTAIVYRTCTRKTIRNLLFRDKRIIVLWEKCKNAQSKITDQSRNTDSTFRILQVG